MKIQTLKFYILLSATVFCLSLGNVISKAEEALKPNLSGKWKWQGVQSNQVILFGELILRDDGRNITGERKRQVPGPAGNLAVPASIELETVTGKWTSKYALQLEIKNKNGKITKASLLTNTNAKRLEGSFQESVKTQRDSFEVSTLRGSPIAKKLGKNFKLEYDIVAVRVK